jgi:hypothetical protein
MAQDKTTQHNKNKHRERTIQNDCIKDIFLVGMVFGCGDDRILCFVSLFAESVSSGKGRSEIPARRLSSLDWFLLLAPFETATTASIVSICQVSSDLGYVVLGHLLLT